ncbi:hypothetical protein [Albidovulum sp.]|uniref:hypothetical protein n=1 Tax=Albidovulum sp. TaxID=1872424 RepID=UPI0039B98223
MPPKFLARSSYRRRRIIDAARILPVLGLFIFFIPVLWHPADTPEPDTARGGLYLFAGWFGIIVAAFLLARVLMRAEPPPAEDAGRASEDR